MTTTHIFPSIRFWLIFFSIALILSGISAILVRPSLDLLSPLFAKGSIVASLWPSMAIWLTYVRQAVDESLDKFPFLGYGLDWLAFGHFVIAIPFLMAARDPHKSDFVISFGMLACAAVIPFGLLFGAIRGIPLYWRGIDCLFGIGGLIVLFIIRKQMHMANAAS